MSGRSSSVISVPGRRREPVFANATSFKVMVRNWSRAPERIAARTLTGSYPVVLPVSASATSTQTSRLRDGPLVTLGWSPPLIAVPHRARAPHMKVAAGSARRPLVRKRSLGDHHGGTAVRVARAAPRTVCALASHR